MGKVVDLMASILPATVSRHVLSRVTWHMLSCLQTNTGSLSSAATGLYVFPYPSLF